MTSTNIHSLDDLWKWLEIPRPYVYDDVAKDIFKTSEDKIRKEKRRIRRRLGRQQRAIQKYVKINDEMPF